MGLERRGGNSYFYRKARQGGRGVSGDMGGGGAAPLMARMDAIWRERREARCEDRKAARRRIDAEDAKLVALFDRIEAVARGALDAAGYHRHKRGEWRKRRMAKKDGAGADGGAAIVA